MPNKNERRVMQRCGRYEHRPVLMCSTNPDHLEPSTPSLTDIPPLQVAPRAVEPGPTNTGPRKREYTEARFDASELR